jgi:hypothetical protein
MSSVGESSMCRLVVCVREEGVVTKACVGAATRVANATAARTEIFMLA